MTATVQDNHTQRRSIALTVSVVLHALLILFFILYKIITPIPPFPEKEGGGSGYELALGFSELGMGDNNAVDPSIPAAQQESSPPPVEQAEVLTSEVDESDVIKPKEKDKPKTELPKTDKPKLTEEQIRKAKQDKIDALLSDKGTGNTGKGTSDTPGNAGGPDGSADGKGIGKGTGSYKGDGWSHDLAGRSIKRAPVINEKPSVGGKVVLNIVVSEDGRVISAEQNLTKSTTMSHNLVNLAKRAALESGFDKRSAGSGEQRGTMTFVFVLD